MNNVLAKTFGGLSRQYYIRNLLFGLIFPIFYAYGLPGSITFPVGVYVLFAINTILYPYSRFVYESVVNYIVGDNVFFVNVIPMMFAKFITMAFCWAGAIFIAPLGLTYLYFKHGKASS